jgi:hypothetical protein
MIDVNMLFALSSLYLNTSQNELDEQQPFLHPTRNSISYAFTIEHTRQEETCLNSPSMVECKHRPSIDHV